MCVLVLRAKEKHTFNLAHHVEFQFEFLELIHAMLACCLFQLHDPLKLGLGCSQVAAEFSFAPPPTLGMDGWSCVTLCILRGAGVSGIATPRHLLGGLGVLTYSFAHGLCTCVLLSSGLEKCPMR